MQFEKVSHPLLGRALFRRRAISSFTASV